jgi:hypothetical protein
MSDRIDRALAATRESKRVDFKSEADLDASHTWPELVKDIMAMANSGGGIIVVGLDNRGAPSRRNVGGLLDLDPAVVTDKIHKYTGEHFEDFEIHERRKLRRRVAVIEVGAVETPVPFTNVGTYEVDGKQRNAFSKGAVYFRHGAKSEPGTTADLRKAFERQLATVRKAWLSGVRTVSVAPPSARIAALVPGQRVIASDAPGALPIRLTDDPAAPAYQALDYDKTHPYRQKELVARVNKRLAGVSKVNSYDIQCVNRVRADSRDERYCHHPKYSSPQYSERYVDWLVERVSQDPDFFKTARTDRYKADHPRA